MTLSNTTKRLLIRAAGVAAGLPLAVMVLGGCTVQMMPAEEQTYSSPPPPRRVIVQRQQVQQPPVVQEDAAPPPPLPDSSDATVSVDADQPEPVETPPPEVVTTYETDLNPYGHWVMAGNYGRCWGAECAAARWRPYSVGHWVDSDQGWLWVADGDEAAWGDVAFHYGRWYSDPTYGWVWVPGTVWRRAWCAWRGGNGYCGWCPLPPGVGIDASIALVNRYCPSDRFVFCDEHFMGESRLHDHIVINDVTIYRRTTNITKITVVDGRVINRGVAVAEIERVSGRQIERVTPTRATSQEEVKRLRAQGKPAIYEPPVVAKAAIARLTRLGKTENAGRTPPKTDERGRTNPKIDDRGRTETTPPERGRTEPKPDDRGRTETTPPERGRTDPKADDRGRTDTTPPERGRTEPKTDDRGKTDATPPERGKTEPKADDRGRTDPTPPERGRTEPKTDDRGKTDATPPERGKTEPKADDRGHGDPTPPPKAPTTRPGRGN